MNLSGDATYHTPSLTKPISRRPLSRSAVFIALTLGLVAIVGLGLQQRANNPLEVDNTPKTMDQALRRTLKDKTVLPSRNLKEENDAPRRNHREGKFTWGEMFPLVQESRNNTRSFNGTDIARSGNDTDSRSFGNRTLAFNDTDIARSGNDTDARNFGNRTLSEMTEAPVIVEEEVLEPESNAEDADEDDELSKLSPCLQVAANLPDEEKTRKLCQDYLDMPYIQPNCTGLPEIVPRIYHSVAADSTQTYHQLSTTVQNPTFQRNHLGDEEAAIFVKEHCGNDAYEAYKCLVAPAYRADLFRFCALYSVGGVYLDTDLSPFVPLEEMYSTCSVATVGHDFPWREVAGKQMKILAGVPGAPVFKCALDTIVLNVRARAYPATDLLLTGPQMLHQCYLAHPNNVAITYHDTRNARWPYSGMRNGNKILAYEVPSSSKNFFMDSRKDETNYADLFFARKTYADTCNLF